MGGRGGGAEHTGQKASYTSTLEEKPTNAVKQAAAKLRGDKKCPTCRGQGLLIKESEHQTDLHNQTWFCENPQCEIRYYTWGEVLPPAKFRGGS